MYIFCSLSWSSFHWYEVHILSYKKTSSNFGKYVTKWDVDNSLQISSILTKLDMQLWKKSSLGSNCRENVSRRGVNRREKGIIVTFVSFGLHAERFGLECTDYGNTLFFIFWHFHIRFVEFYFGFKDCRVLAVSHRLAASHLL